jgi:hypothetical protein
MKNKDPKPTNVTPSDPQIEEGPIETGRLLVAGGTVAVLLTLLILLKFVFNAI